MLGEYVSATVVSTATNFIMEQETAFTRTYRTYIKLRETGLLELKFWHSNGVDSTWDGGKVARGSMPGGNWKIESAYVAVGGMNRDGSIIPGTASKVSFDGKDSKEVVPAEQFWSDPVLLDLPPGQELVFSWTISTDGGRSFPYNTEGILVSAFEADGHKAHEVQADSFTASENRLVMPAFIGYKKQVKERVVFVGDSITQGVRTLQDGYEYWVARIADGLGADYGIWNVGSGWARAYDAAADGSWLAKSKQGDIVAVALGVNDIDIGNRSAQELIDDLSTIIRKLKQNSEQDGVRVILFTVPPFNFIETREAVWRTVNETIRTSPPEGTDYVFDIAEVLSCPVPEEHRIDSKYMSSEFDPHPNGEAGKQVADAFLKWFRAQSL
ncbi:SGNH/GDSL hydrolase family protein [Paenibacillus sp. Marseille-Q4541]|uniref:SGNH/GDSL hydrolase family protein n=1 Tax=Paenibacillus sp. Marseille-Q4541 TaxID=2831522 RepID=UPI001BAACD02|nr:SGNH/GDSL hydrolase family protein [Paenibacillus sp. Marseille-Q4541]